MNSLGVEEESEEDAICQREMAACGVEDADAELDVKGTTMTGLLRLSTAQSLDEDWLPYFVVLDHHALLWYADAAHTDLQGSATLLPTSVVHDFADESSPWHSTALCTKHPCGFVIDVDSHLGAEEKVLLYFDALQIEQTVLWLVALQSALGTSCKDVTPAQLPNAEEVEVVEIDDFSDYEEDSHAALHERSSSFSHRYSADWGAEAEVAARGEAEIPNYEIDDFSDYEDDENARRSSIVNLSLADWSKINQVAS